MDEREELERMKVRGGGAPPGGGGAAFMGEGGGRPTGWGALASTEEARRLRLRPPLGPTIPPGAVAELLVGAEDVGPLA